MAGFLIRLVAGASAVTVLTYLIAMAIAVVLLFSTSIGGDLSSHQGTVILGAFLIPIYTPFRIDLLAGFFVLFGIYVLCFASAARSNGGYLAGLRGLFNGSTQRRLPNWLIVMPVASSALLLVVLAITLAQSAVGVSTGSLPTLEPYKLLYALAYAPPLEETMFRISTLGLIVAFRVIWSSLLPDPSLEPRLGPLQRRPNLSRLIILSFMSPEEAKNEAGLPTFTNNRWRAFHWSEWFFLILTSAGFGLAHFLSGVGWEAGKITTATLAGLALGLAYLAYGGYASILLHWFFNVYFDVFSLGSTFLGGIFVALDGLTALLVVATGIIGIAAGITWLLSGPPKGNQTTYMIPSTSSSPQA